MAEIVQFPLNAAYPPLHLIAGTDSIAVLMSTAKGRRSVAWAMENMSSAFLELTTVNTLSLKQNGDVADLVSEEVITGLCRALIAIVDAKRCRNDDLPLRRAAMQAIAEREGVYHEHEG